MMDADRGVYYELDPIAARVWTLLETARPVAEVCDVPTGEYVVSSEGCLRDVVALLQQAQELSMVEVRAPEHDDPRAGPDSLRPPMSAICGIHLRAGGPPPRPRRPAGGVAGPPRGHSCGMGRGPRPVSAGAATRPAGEAAPERLPRVDRRAGLAVTASARLDDRAALCAALGVPHPRRSDVPDGELILKSVRALGPAVPGAACSATTPSPCGT